MLNKKKRAKFIDFQKKILTPFCKKGLGQPAKKSLMSGFKDGGGYRSRLFRVHWSRP